MTNKAVLKAITEDAVIYEVKAVIDLTGLAIQRMNTGAFAIGSGKTRRFIRTANKGRLTSRATITVGGLSVLSVSVQLAGACQ